MELILVVAFWALLAMAAGWYADRLGRSSVGWALFSLILSPLLGFVMLFALGERRDEEDDQEEADDRAPCPFCAESILRAAGFVGVNCHQRGRPMSRHAGDGCKCKHRPRATGIAGGMAHQTPNREEREQMDKRIIARSAAMLVALVAGVVFTASAADKVAGQADLPQSLPCPYAGGAGPFVETGIEVPLETKAGAVLITASMEIVMSPNAGFLIRPTVDGAAPAGVHALHFIGEAQGETTTLLFSRAYEVEAGPHTFRLQFSCQGSVNARAGWLTVIPVR